MANKIYTIIGNTAYDGLLNPTAEIRQLSSWYDKEGDFNIIGGVAYPILRFDSIPFGGRVSGGNMIFQFGISNTLLNQSPKVACIGSSTMAGQGLSSPNRLEDRLNAWLTANTTTPSAIQNAALGGQTLTNLRTVANGGTAGRNIEWACDQNPSFIYVDEPTNWAAAYDVATQVSYMMEIFTYAFQRGVIVIFGGARPRTPYTGTAATRITSLDAALRSHPVLRYVCVINFDVFLEPATQNSLKTIYDQGDGIHINAAGISVLSDSITAWWQRVLLPVSAFNRYEIEKSADGSTGWAVVNTITDLTSNTLTITSSTGYYRIRARLKNNTYTSYSNIVYLESVAEVEAKFNFNATAQTVTDWINVTGNPFAAVVTSTVYPGTTIYIRTVRLNASSANVWGNTSGTSSNNNVGQQTGNNSGAMPDLVLVSNAFTTSQSYVAGNEQIEIRGLTPGAAYTFKGMGSRSASAVPAATRLMDWNIVDANGLQTIQDYNVKGNTATLATFTGLIAINDAGEGVIKLAINRPTPTDANHDFGYCNGLTIKKEI